MSNENVLAGKTALVTGSTHGIGLEIAKRLAECGCHIGLNGFAEADTVDQIVAEIQLSSPVNVRFCEMDLRDVDSIYLALEAFAGDFGTIDILVNNAGVQHVSRVEDFPNSKWDEVIAVNLSAVFHCSKAVIPAMIQNGWGRIINIASVHGLVGSVEKAAYIAAKHAVVGLTKVIALENARHGLTCNAICPGFTNTEMIRKQVQDRAAEEGRMTHEIELQMLSEKHPTGRFIEPDDIGALVAYLCSNEARGITGTTVAIDGGWTAR